MTHSFTLRSLSTQGRTIWCLGKLQTPLWIDEEGVMILLIPSPSVLQTGIDKKVPLYTITFHPTTRVPALCERFISTIDASIILGHGSAKVQYGTFIFGVLEVF